MVTAEREASKSAEFPVVGVGASAGGITALQSLFKAISGKPNLAIVVVTLGRETRAAFYLTHGEGASLRHIVGMPVQYAAALNGTQIGPESLARGLTTHARKQVITIDVHEDPGWEPWRWLAERFGYREVWNFPINTSAGKFVGALVIYLAQLRKPDKRDTELAGLLTNTASIIISRQRESEARQRIEQVRGES